MRWNQALRHSSPNATLPDAFQINRSELGYLELCMRACGHTNEDRQSRHLVKYSVAVQIVPRDDVSELCLRQGLALHTQARIKMRVCQEESYCVGRRPCGVGLSRLVAL